MARTVVAMPQVGMGAETARVVRWLKREGDELKAGEPLLEVETDKAALDIEVPTTGILVKILVPEGEETSIGDALAWVQHQGDENVCSLAVEQPEPTESSPPESSSDPPDALTGIRARRNASPAARREARANGIDVQTIEGSGPHGRIVLSDVARASEQPPALAQTPQVWSQDRLDLTPMRRAIARTMAQSAAIPQFSVSRSVDWTQVTARRQQLVESGVPVPSATDFLLYALSHALLEHPALNSVFIGDPFSDEAHIRPSRGTHIGLAVALPKGLLVPVMHRVDTLSLLEIAERREELVTRARVGKFQSGDLDGATMTLSNLGVGGPDWFVPLLNPPESGILAVGRAKPTPVVAGESIVVRSRSQLVLTLDHRLVDGKSGSEFLQSVVARLEDPWIE